MNFTHYKRNSAFLGLALFFVFLGYSGFFAQVFTHRQGTLLADIGGFDSEEPEASPSLWAWGADGNGTDEPGGIGWVDMSRLEFAEDGAVTGYAWSANLGWLQFGGLGRGTINAFPDAKGNTKTNAKMVDGEFTGWARFLARDSGWDGWVSLKGEKYSIIETEDPEVGRTIAGYAWAGDAGWLHFNLVYPPAGKESDAPGCTANPNPAPVGEAVTWTATGVSEEDEVIWAETFNPSGEGGEVPEPPLQDQPGVEVSVTYDVAGISVGSFSTSTDATPVECLAELFVIKPIPAVTLSGKRVGATGPAADVEVIVPKDSGVNLSWEINEDEFDNPQCEIKTSAGSVVVGGITASGNQNSPRQTATDTFTISCQDYTEVTEELPAEPIGEPVTDDFRVRVIDTGTTQEF